jgi:hypothetical protein
VKRAKDLADKNRYQMRTTQQCPGSDREEQPTLNLRSIMRHDGKLAFNEQLLLVRNSHLI